MAPNVLFRLRFAALATKALFFARDAEQTYLILLPNSIQDVDGLVLIRKHPKVL